ncbi:MAG: 16S rRNA (adenine(1518)-N(6)/adenine(1519)-N(6))-dimethyltransferase RsmA [Coriobacteriales bacterium]|jgi:16S rRNA (adenine1518-N6/adenine1519-N6)-dimethyltransferase|nr:16S rRNA (adenine(1518)-N(6)/adenine(1519)-N(6))-dimethyltransferase RsmA [Coriobacteriales bacterium]
MPCNSPLASPAATIALLRRWGLYTKKSLGQHFLVDDGVVGKIIRLAALDNNLPVVEIGTGIGTLTEALLITGAHVVGIEIDSRMKEILEDISNRYPGQFSHLLTDALLLEPTELPEQFDLVANLPYSVAATIILDFFRRFEGLHAATVMVQREVAERIMAVPGSKAYGAYTVKLAFLAEVKSSFKVSHTSFLPPPRVDSTVIRLQRLADTDSSESLVLHQWSKVQSLIDAAFAERRKTIFNSLRSALAASGITGNQIKPVLESADIDGRRRAESLNLDEFKRLLAAFDESTGFSTDR